MASVSLDELPSQLQHILPGAIHVMPSVPLKSVVATQMCGVVWCVGGQCRPTQTGHRLASDSVRVCVHGHTETDKFYLELSL